MDDSAEVDLRACELCSKEGPIENYCMHGDIWVCESCDVKFREHFAACAHEWEPHNLDGDEGCVCTKCNGFVRLEDFDDVVGSAAIRARSEQEGK